MLLKGFSLGAAIMSIFTFFITTVFLYIGTATVDNSKFSTRTVEVLKQLNQTLVRIDTNLQLVNRRVEKMSDKMHEYNEKLYKFHVDLENLKGSNQ